MRRRVWPCVLLVIALCTAGAAPAQPPASPPPPPAPRDLLAHGSADAFWVARVGTDEKTTTVAAKGVAAAAPATHVFVRTWGGPWRELQPEMHGIGRRVVSMAHRGAQLALLMDDGQWMLLSDDSAATGQPIATPGASLICLSNDAHTLWAVARLPGGIASLRPTTAPVTAPAATRATSVPSTPATTLPATIPAAPAARAALAIGPLPEPTLSLLVLSSAGWAGQADLPPDVAGRADAVSLAMVEDVPHVAVRTGAGPVRLYRLTADKQWAPAGVVALPPEASTMQLLTGTPRPVLWAGAQAAPDALIFFEPNGARTVRLDATRPASANLRAAAWATGKIRSVYGVDGRLFEQGYDEFTGAKSGEPVVIPAQASPLVGPDLWLGSVVTVAMLFAIGASFRQRDALRGVRIDLEQIHLAPQGRRLIAGLIDALPVVVAWVVRATHVGAAGGAARAIGDPAGSFDAFTAVVFAAGLAVYLLHTTLTEVLLGRSLGKIVCGLRVASLTGQPPRPAQLVMRNLLRIIDAGLMFLPLILILFSPLRQRAGDAAAATIVVVAQDKETMGQGDKGTRGQGDAP